MTDGFKLSRDFNVSRSLLFECFSDVKHLAQWWGPKGVTIVKPVLDFRPGGIFHYGIDWGTGAIMWGRFVFREIKAPERIVFLNSFSDEEAGLVRAPFFDGKWPLEVLTVFEFEELGANRSHFNLTWTPEDAPPKSAPPSRPTLPAPAKAGRARWRNWKLISPEYKFCAAHERRWQRVKSPHPHAYGTIKPTISRALAVMGAAMARARSEPSFSTEMT